MCLNNLTSDVDKISIFNPLSPFLSLPKFLKEKNKIFPEYNKILEEGFNLSSSPVEGPGVAMAFTQSWSTAKGLTSIIKLQEAWRSLDALLDRKYAYSFGIFSLYIAIISLVITTISLFK